VNYISRALANGANSWIKYQLHPLQGSKLAELNTGISRVLASYPVVE
jgi:hypothetical protein